MTAVILTIHALVVLALIGVVLVQRSDGGALGIGGGGGGGFMSGRGAANALTRTTSVLAAIFFATSLGLAIIAGNGEADESLIQELTTEDTAEAAPVATPENPTSQDLLEALGNDTSDDTSDDAAIGPVTDADAENATVPAETATDPVAEDVESDRDTAEADDE